VKESGQVISTKYSVFFTSEFVCEICCVFVPIILIVAFVNILWNSNVAEFVEQSYNKT